MQVKPYHMRFTAGPLAGKVLRVLATDPLDAAGIAGRELREYAIYTTSPAEQPADLFGAETTDTITIEQAREALKADAS